MRSRVARLGRWGGLALLLGALAGCAQPQIRPQTALLQRPYEYSDRDWARVLHDRVRNGLVDYDGLAAHPQDLERYYALISVTGPTSTPDQFPTRAAATAYWINAYNAMLLKAVLSRYPIRSMYDLSLPRLETEYSFQADRRILTLEDTQGEMLASSDNDVRTLLATSRAALGTPPLASEPFRAETLDRQLAAAAVKALDDPHIMRIDPGTHSIYLWQLILRREQDFENFWRSRRRVPAGRLLDALTELASPKRRRALHSAAGYMFRESPFDRTLNATQQRKQVP